MNEREEFEAWCYNKHLLARSELAFQPERNCYSEPHVHRMWQAWQAARAAAPQQAPAQPVAHGYCEEGNRCVCGGDLPSIREGCSNWRRANPVAWPHDAEDRVNDLLGQLTRKELECQRMREQLSLAPAAQAAPTQAAAGPLTNIVTDAIDGYKAGLAGGPMGIVSEAFDCGWYSGDAERRAAQAAPTQAPAQPVAPMFAVGVAQRKWESLQGDGYRMQSIAFSRADGKTGTIDPWGKVLWTAQAAPSAPAIGRVTWPKARDLFRRDDMGQGQLRVLFDADNDVIVAIWPEGERSVSVEFCCPGSGGGKSPRTREALIALMVAMEQDGATHHPSDDTPASGQQEPT